MDWHITAKSIDQRISRAKGRDRRPGVVLAEFGLYASDAIVQRLLREVAE